MSISKSLLEAVGKLLQQPTNQHSPRGNFVVEAASSYDSQDAAKAVADKLRSKHDDIGWGHAKKPDGRWYITHADHSRADIKRHIGQLSEDVLVEDNTVPHEKLPAKVKAVVKKVHATLRKHGATSARVSVTAHPHYSDRSPAHHEVNVELGHTHIENEKLVDALNSHTKAKDPWKKTKGDVHVGPSASMYPSPHHVIREDVAMSFDESQILDEELVSESRFGSHLRRGESSGRHYKDHHGVTWDDEGYNSAGTGPSDRRERAKAPRSAQVGAVKHYHEVPYAKKEDAKNEGMKWHAEKKKWYHSDAGKSATSKFKKINEEVEFSEETVDESKQLTARMAANAASNKDRTPIAGIDHVKATPSNRTTHRVSVVVSTPGKDGQSTRNARVTAGGEHEAVGNAKRWYEKQGMKVHSASYVKESVEDGVACEEIVCESAAAQTHLANAFASKAGSWQHDHHMANYHHELEKHFSDTSKKTDNKALAASQRDLMAYHARMKKEHFDKAIAGGNKINESEMKPWEADRANMWNHSKLANYHSEQGKKFDDGPVSSVLHAIAHHKAAALHNKASDHYLSSHPSAAAHGKAAHEASMHANRHIHEGVELDEAKQDKAYHQSQAVMHEKKAEQYEKSGHKALADSHNEKAEFHNQKAFDMKEEIDAEEGEILDEEHNTRDQAQKQLEALEQKHPLAKHSVIQGRRSGKWHVVRHTSGGMHVVEGVVAEGDESEADYQKYLEDLRKKKESKKKVVKEALGMHSEHEGAAARYKESAEKNKDNPSMFHKYMMDHHDAMTKHFNQIGNERQADRHSSKSEVHEYKLKQLKQHNKDFY